MTKEKSVGIGVIGKMTVQELIQFDLKFEFVTFEKLSTFFKNKVVNKLHEYIRGLDNLLSAIEKFEFELESKLFE